MGRLGGRGSSSVCPLSDGGALEEPKETLSVPTLLSIPFIRPQQSANGPQNAQGLPKTANNVQLFGLGVSAGQRNFPTDSNDSQQPQTSFRFNV